MYQKEEEEKDDRIDGLAESIGLNLSARAETILFKLKAGEGPFRIVNKDY